MLDDADLKEIAERATDLALGNTHDEVEHDRVLNTPALLLALVHALRDERAVSGQLRAAGAQDHKAHDHALALLQTELRDLKHRQGVTAGLFSPTPSQVAADELALVRLENTRLARELTQAQAQCATLETTIEELRVELAEVR